MQGHSFGLFTFLFISILSRTVGFEDICQQKYLTFPFAGERGVLGVSESSGPTGNSPCILRLQGCSQCRISVQPMGNDWHFPESNCSASYMRPQYSLKECIPGCNYLFLFDSVYLNETLQFYTHSGWPRVDFKSLSSAVFIGLCSSPQSPPNIKLQYYTDLNQQTLSSQFGYVRSPNFPNGYVQNGDVYTWVIKNTQYSRISVVFDDWHISPFSGEIFFDDSNTARPINGSMNRPVIRSRSNKMKVIFSTGHHFLGDQSRYMGFKFKYTFYRENDNIPTVSTDCGRKYLINSGGVIDFQMINSNLDYTYDCTWIIKKQSQFDKVYMKIIKFRRDDMLSHSTHEVKIRDGLTSDGEVMDTVYANKYEYDPFISKTGFYIRFRGLLRPMDNLRIVFTSFREQGYSDCNNHGMFYCGTGRCIPANLKCDRYDHCGDKSDESNNANCLSGGAGWSRSSNYTMTVSVIVPLVISVFLLVILCVLFFLIRRCHNARAQELDRDAGIIPTISAGLGRRRRGRNRQAQRPAEFPPTYEEALESPPYEEPPLERISQQGYENGFLKPPTYHEAIGNGVVMPPEEEYGEEDEIPPPEFSTIDRSQQHNSTTGSEEIRPVNHSHSMSYSSESSTEIPANRNVSHINSPPYTEVTPQRRLMPSHREQREEEYMERCSRHPGNRSSGQTRPKDDMEQERKLMDDQTQPAFRKRGSYSHEPEQLSHSKPPGKDEYRERRSLPPNTSSGPESYSKAANFNKDEQHCREGNQRRSEGDWRSKASDNSSNCLLFNEEHFTERENRGFLNHAFKDYDRSSLNSQPRTNSASLANLQPLERWVDDRRGMAMSLQQLPTTHCVASSDIRASEHGDLPRRMLTADQRSTSASQEVIRNQQHLQPTNRNISLSVGNLPTHHSLQQHSNQEPNRTRRLPNPSSRSVSLGDLNRRVNSPGGGGRRQAHSQTDLSNIQEESSPNSIVFACNNEDVFV